MDKVLNVIPKYAEIFIFSYPTITFGTKAVVVADGPQKIVDNLQIGDVFMVPIEWHWEEQFVPTKDVKTMFYTHKEITHTIFFRELEEGWVPNIDWMFKPLSTEARDIASDALDNKCSLGAALMLGFDYDICKEFNG